jgi:hypothetical protein
MVQDVTQWQAAADELLGLRNSDGGWPYRSAAASSTEPTALAALALADAGADSGVLSSAADWLVARQLANGAFTASPAHQEASWLTGLAALTLARLGRAEPAAAAVQALLAAQVFTFTQFPPGTYGYDTTLAGWPWSPGAFSFVEPTALAVLFLKQSGQSGRDRVRGAVALLRDRALAAGGWNYGEPEVLGGRLFPTDAPTALTLLALANEQDDHTAAGLNWLQGRQGQITSLYSLGWAAIALNVLGVITGQWRDDVIALWNASPPQRRDAVGTALCLLALRSREAHPFAVI